MLCGSLDGRGVWQRTDTCLNTIESLHCSLETITTLLIGYTPIQNKSVLKINKKILCVYYSIRIIFLSFFFFFFFYSLDLLNKRKEVSFAMRFNVVLFRSSLNTVH